MTIMTKEATTEFQKLCLNQIKSLRLEYKGTIQQHADAGVLIAIVHLAGCTAASVGESPKLTLIVQNISRPRGISITYR